jgi:hypothetical protein
MLKDIAKVASSILDNFFANALSHFSDINVKAEPTVRPPILNDQSVISWLNFVEPFTGGYPGHISYLIVKEASGGKLNVDTARTARVCACYFFFSYVDSSHHTATLQCSNEYQGETLSTVGRLAQCGHASRGGSFRVPGPHDHRLRQRH